jgi:hypothetical protein
MNKEYGIILFQWVITTGLLIRFIDKSKIREAFVAFTCKQILTWILGLVVVEFGLIEYPVRLFANANKTSFTFEYFVYPAICAIFNVNFPEKKSKINISIYYISYCTIITILEVLVERNTRVLKYIHWSWYTTWITLFITFFITRRFYVWYFRLDKKT